MSKYYLPFTDEIVSEPPPDTFAVPLQVERPEGIENTSIKDGIQFALDNTSIALFKTCPRKYKLTILDGWNLKSMPLPLKFGIHFHSIMQTWHILKTSDTPKDEALLRVVRLAGLLGETLHSGDNTRGKEQLLRSTIWYIETFWEDSARTVMLSTGKPAVEYSFTLPFFEHNGDQIYLCGHLDRVVKWQGKVYTSDFKTTKYPLDSAFPAKFKPSGQFTLYSAATHIIADATQDLPAADGILLDAIQLGVNFNRYQRYIVPFSLEEIDEYLTGLRYWIIRLREAAEAGAFPANEEACGLYGGCVFREICSHPPARREAYLRGHFKQSVWDPLQSR